MAAGADLGRSQLWLASTSPRRRALLREAGFRFQVLGPGVDETTGARAAASAAAMRLARRKAAAAVRALGRAASGVVLAADTIVGARGKLLGKARDRREARAILRALSGTTHQVVTGVCLVALPAGRARVFAVRTRVTMRAWEPREIEDYLDSGEWRGKAGAYAIQESADRFVTRLRGSWTNVVGLPMERVERELRKLGITAAPRARGRGTGRRRATRAGARRRRSRG